MKEKYTGKDKAIIRAGRNSAFWVFLMDEFKDEIKVIKDAIYALDTNDLSLNTKISNLKGRIEEIEQIVDSIESA